MVSRQNRYTRRALRYARTMGILTFVRGSGYICRDHGFLTFDDVARHVYFKHNDIYEVMKNGTDNRIR